MHTYMEGSRCMHALGRGSRCLGECVGGWSKCLGGVQVPGRCPCVWVKSHVLGGGLCDLPSESISLHSLLPPTIVSREANLQHPSEDSRRLHHDEGRWVGPRLGSMSSCCPGLSVGPGVAGLGGQSRCRCNRQHHRVWSVVLVGSGWTKAAALSLGGAGCPLRFGTPVTSQPSFPEKTGPLAWRL